MDRPDCDAIPLALSEDALGARSSAVEQVAERLGEGLRLLRTVARSAAALEALPRMRLSRRTPGHPGTPTSLRGISHDNGH